MFRHFEPRRYGRGVLLTPSAITRSLGLVVTVAVSAGCASSLSVTQDGRTYVFPKGEFLSGIEPFVTDSPKAMDQLSSLRTRAGVATGLASLGSVVGAVGIGVVNYATLSKNDGLIVPGLLTTVAGLVIALPNLFIKPQKRHYKQLLEIHNAERPDNPVYSYNLLVPPPFRAPARVEHDSGARIARKPVKLGMGLLESDGGLIVTVVKADSIAARAGLRSDDVLYAIGETRIRSLDDFTQAGLRIPRHDPFTIVISRGGELMKLSTSLEPGPDAEDSAEPAKPNRRVFAPTE